MARIPLSVREMAILRALVVAGGTQMEWDNRFEMGPIRNTLHEDTVSEMAARGMVTRAPIKGASETGEKARNVLLMPLGFLCYQCAYYEDDWFKNRPDNEDVRALLVQWFDSAAKMAKALFPVSEDIARIERATAKATAPVKASPLVEARKETGRDRLNAALKKWG